MANETVKKTITVTLLLCLVCSILVSGAAVSLRPAQIANQELDFKRNILSTVGLLDPARSVEEVFDERVTIRVVDLNTGEYTDEISPQAYDQSRVARGSNTSTPLSRDEDIAGIQRREDYALVYLVEDSNGELESIVLPVRAYGLWSTMWGFLALEADANTVRGLRFYEHGETPGLGGEIDNPRWQARWEGKQVYDDEGNVALRVIKGSVNPDEDGAEHRVDGLSGATLTTRGADNMIQFWLGEQGFKSYLSSRREEA